MCSRVPDVLKLTDRVDAVVFGFRVCSLQD